MLHVDFKNCYGSFCLNSRRHRKSLGVKCDYGSGIWSTEFFHWADYCNQINMDPSSLHFLGVV